MKLPYRILALAFLMLSIDGRAANFPYITLSTTNRYKDNGTTLTRNGVPIGGNVVASGPSAAGQLLTASGVDGVGASWSVLKSFDPTKTYFAVFGNSIALTGGVGITGWTTLITNAWPGLKFYTNYAIGGSTHLEATNAYYSNALSVLPATATNGTNVFIIDYDALLTFNTGAWTNYQQGIDAYSAWASDIHSRGYTFVIPTTMPMNSFPVVGFNSPTLTNFIGINNWVLRSSNIVDFSPDFASVLPNCLNTNQFLDGVHPTQLGHELLANEFDNVVRLGNRRLMQPVFHIGTNYVSATSDGGCAAMVNENGVVISPSFYAGGNGAAGSLTVFTGSGGVGMIDLINGAGKTYFLSSLNSGGFYIRNNSDSRDILAIQEKPTTISNNVTNQVGYTHCTGNFGLGGEVRYKIFCSDGTDYQLGSGVLHLAAVTKGTTVTIAQSDDHQLLAASGGTLTWAVTAVQVGNDFVAFDVAPVSSLTPTVMNFRAVYEIQNTATVNGDITTQ